MCQLPDKFRSVFPTLVGVLAAMLVLGADYARARALPVLDLSGVWIAQARPSTFCSGSNTYYSPIATYTLTLSRKDMTVTAGSVRIDYNIALVIDGYKSRDDDGASDGRKSPAVATVSSRTRWSPTATATGSTTVRTARPTMSSVSTHRLIQANLS